MRVAEIDGITFYSKSALDEYLLEKERRDKGMNRYTVGALRDHHVAEVINILETKGCFDYCVRQDGCYKAVEYYAKKPLIEMVWESR